jgi:hypothetical protein
MYKITQRTVVPTGQRLAVALETHCKAHWDVNTEEQRRLLEPWRWGQ